MPDVFTKTKRSEVMSRIRGRGNKETELALIRLLRRQGITGWRRYQAVFGEPDLVFPKVKLAVFVDGGCWHGCAKHGSQPANQPRVLAVQTRREPGARPAGEPRVAACGLAGRADWGT